MDSTGEKDFSIKQRTMAFLHRCWIVIRHCWNFYFLDKLGAQSLSLTYYTLFAIVPIAALAFGIAKGFNFEEYLRAFLVEHFGQYHHELLDKMLVFVDTTLKSASGGWMSVISILFLFYAAFMLVYRIESVFNDIWKQPANENFLRIFLRWSCRNIAFIVFLPFLLVLLSVAVPALRAYLINIEQCYPNWSFLFRLTIFLLPILLTAIFLCIIYFALTDAKPRAWPVVIASILTGIALLLFQELFIWMQRSLFNYNKVYGSFAAVPLFLIWMSWSWLIILNGAELARVINDYGDLALNDEEDSTLTNLVRKLNLAAVIYLHHHEKKGSILLAELLEQLNLNESHIACDLQDIVNAGLIVKSKTEDGKVCYNACLPESTTLIEALERLLKGGKSGLNGENGNISKALQAFTKQCSPMKENCLLYELTLEK